MAIGRISGPMLFSNLERQGIDLAFESNLLYLDVTNSRVGVINSSPQYAFDTPGNVKLANIIINGSTIRSNTGFIDLGSTANIRLTGGALNYVLYTDGDGNVSWGEISNLDIQWGNLLLANNTVSVTNLNGNLNLQSNGTGNVVTTNDFYAGNIYALNIVGSVSSNGGAFTGNVSAPTFVGNLIASNVIANTATIISGNAITWYSTDLNATTGNITTLVSANFSAANAVISGGYISSLSNITATTGNVESWYTAELNSTNGNITTLVGTNISTANALITGGVITNVNLQANNFSTANAVIEGGYISSMTNITATTGNVESWYAANLNSTSGNITTLVTTDFSSTNASITSGNVTANVTGNVTGTFASFNANVNANWFVGNVDGLIGNFSNINVNSNLTVAGNLTASGNILSQQITSPVGDLHISAATNDPNNIIRFDSVSALDIASGTTNQRPPTPDYGYLRYNIDYGSIEWWTGVSWVQGIQNISSEIINPDGINNTFTLSQIATENSILVNINGTIQQAGAGAYSVAGNQITFAEIPLVTDIIEIRFIAGGVAVTSYGNTQVGAYLTSYTGNISAANITTSGNTTVSGNLNVASTSGTPSNTASPASWLKVHVGGVEYFMPLYQ